MSMASLSLPPDIATRSGFPAARMSGMGSGMESWEMSWSRVFIFAPVQKKVWVVPSPAPGVTLGEGWTLGVWEPASLGGVVVAAVWSFVGLQPDIAGIEAWIEVGALFRGPVAGDRL